MKTKIFEIMKSILGKKCCRASISSYKTLSLGFGEKVYHNNSKLQNEFYGEWEIGTYRCSWRILKGNKILLGKTDTEEISEMNERISKIKFGEIVSINHLSKLDIRIELKNNLFVDFFTTFSDMDESIHVFCPDNIYLSMDNNGKWSVDKSDKPFAYNK